MSAFDDVRQNSERPRNTRVLLWVLYGLLTVTCISGAALVFIGYKGVTLSQIFGAVFVVFSIFKITLSYDAYMAPRAVAPQSDQRQESGKLFNLWLLYKIVPAVIWGLLGLYLVIFGVHYIDHMARGFHVH